MRNSLIGFGVMVVFLSIFSCSNSKKEALPYLGFHEVANGDTTYHRIPAFRLVNQDSQSITNATFADKVYIADFFFTRCPTICPKLTKSMKRLYDHYSNQEDVLFLSHSIDTYNDSVAVLKNYADKLKVSSDRWHFVTGDRTEIYNIADAYFSVALEDPNAPGGFDHSGRLIVVDQEGHVRAFCNGTDPDEVTALMDDIDWLLNESK